MKRKHIPLAAETQPPFFLKRRCGHGYNLHPALQGSGGKKRRSDDGGTVCLWAQSEKAGSRVRLSLRSVIGPRRVSSDKKPVPGGDGPGRGARGPVFSDPAGVSAR